MEVSKPMKEELMHLVAPQRDHTNLKMELSILDSGLVDSEMEMVAKYGQMVQDTKVLGLTTKPMVTVN